LDSGTKKTGGRIIIECLLAVAIAVFTPLIVMFELVSVQMVLMLPVIGYVFLKNYAGKGVAALSSVLMLVASAFILDVGIMWMIFAMNIIPQLAMQVIEKKPFGTRMQANIIVFLLGAVLSVVVMYFFFGGNLLERYLERLPELLRQVPEEELGASLSLISGVMGREITVEGFYQLFEESISKLIPLYRLNMPGMLLGGALVSAVFSTWLDGWMKFRRGSREKGVFMPVHEWYLPSSTTGGLILIFAVSMVLYYTDFEYGQAVFLTVFQLAVAAFCVQGFASVRRKFHGKPRKALGTVMSLLYFVLVLLGAAPYMALYGLGSAILGSGGVLKQRLDAKMGVRTDKKDNDDENNAE